MAFFLVCCAALALILILVFHPTWLAWRRQRIQTNAFPARWRKVLQRRVPMVRRLPVPLQLQLKKHMQVFVAEKTFIGCAGLVITEEMRVVIAAQACLLLLNRPMDYFQNVRQILVYPGAFAVTRVSTDAAGVQQERRMALAGESWVQGQVILSWQDTLEGAADPADGQNVVIHEFAHQLDQENGAAQGAPPPAPGDTRHNSGRWSRVLGAAFEQLGAERASGEIGLLNHYGAQDPAEFFAVVSEVFFEQGALLAQQYPDLYGEMSGYYKLDPASW
ncbi:MAG: zinc-dependent peptidase [Rhodoferax sp.]|nr:zinc-dependent peptidase [Rhodoferax sp.]MCF8210752.1 zinc-dependent peptidase [Rhodoferax sp.]